MGNWEGASPSVEGLIRRSLCYVLLGKPQEVGTSSLFLSKRWGQGSRAKAAIVQEAADSPIGWRVRPFGHFCGWDWDRDRAWVCVPVLARDDRGHLCLS